VDFAPMSVRVMSAIWEIPMYPTDKLVLLALADCANDQGLCWPSISTVARKSGVSERSVQRSIRAAEKSGLLKRDEVPGKGCKYTLNPRHSATPDTVSPATDKADTPDTVSPKPSGTTKSKKDKPSLSRATTVPLDFWPAMSGRTLATVNAWPSGRLAEEVEHFIDHHTAKGTLSKCWQASWRTWVKLGKKWEPKNGHHRQPAEHEWGRTVSAAEQVIAELERGGRDRGGTSPH
jgi:hypothetical protein